MVFLKLLKKADYSKAFKMAISSSFIQELDEYKQLLKIGKKYETATLDAFNSGKYYDAVKYCETLKEFPAQNEFAIGLREKANIYAETMSYYAQKNFKQVYNMIADHPFLEDVEVSKKIEAIFTKDMHMAEKFMLAGDVAGIKKVMKNYLNIESKYETILNLIKNAYLKDIQNKKELSDKEVEKILTRYTTMFGHDDLIDECVNKKCKVRGLEFDLDAVKSKAFSKPLSTLPDSLVA